MNRFEQLTAKYLDDELSPVETQELATHFRADPRAAKQFAALYIQDQLLAALLRRDDQQAITSIMAKIRSQERASVSSVMQRVREEEGASAGSLGGSSSRDWAWLKRLPRSWLVWTASAALLVIGLCRIVLQPHTGCPVLLATRESAVTVERRGTDFLVSDRIALLPDDLITLSGSSTAVITFAPEQTRLDLAPGTSLRLLDWTWGKRLQLRSGRIEATVAPQRRFRPMVLITPQAEARVVGTRFSLAVSNNASRLGVVEGTVRFTRSGTPGVIVTAGHWAVATTNVQPVALPPTGSILHEYWTNIVGSHDPTWDPALAEHPNGEEILSLFESSTKPVANWGERIRGYLYRPTTGAYIFWIAGDGFARFFLSRDDQPQNRVRLAVSNETKKAPREWTNQGRQQTSALTLVAGRRYYIEALQYDGDAGDHHLAVAWQGPGRERDVIAGEFLSPFETKTKGKKGK